MLRSIILTLTGLLIFTNCAFAQPFRPPPPPRMSMQEASVIAGYWIKSYLRRNARPQEVKHWAARLRNSRSPTDALSEFLASPEYFNYAGGSRHGFIRQLILDVGHREASRFEIEQRLRATAGLNPQTIADAFLREFPSNWWPGPTATPPRELWFFYGKSFDVPPPPFR